MKKVVILGSGLGGLMTGALLSKRGYDVTVLEKHYIPGGYATNFVRKDKEGRVYNFDVSLHGIGDLQKGRTFYDFMDELGVFEYTKPLRKKETATIVYKDGSIFDIPDSFESYLQIMINKYPHEKEGFEKLFAFYKELDDDMEYVYRKK